MTSARRIGRPRLNTPPIRKALANHFAHERAVDVRRSAEFRTAHGAEHFIRRPDRDDLPVHDGDEPIGVLLIEIVLREESSQSLQTLGFESTPLRTKAIEDELDLGVQLDLKVTIWFWHAWYLQIHSYITSPVSRAC
jgi:hypothetical protein